MPRTHKHYTGNSIQIITAPANINTAPRKLNTIRIHKPPHAEKDQLNGWPQAWSAIGQPSNSWPPYIGKLLLRTMGHNVSHSCLKRLIIRLSKHIAQWLPPAHPGSLASQCMSGQPISTCCALTGGPSQQQAKQFNALLGAVSRKHFLACACLTLFCSSFISPTQSRGHLCHSGSDVASMVLSRCLIIASCGHAVGFL